MNKTTSKKFYITTSIPYINDRPHIGHAMELVQADVIARYHQLIGDEVFFLTGTDEHGLKVMQAAEKADIDTQNKILDYCRSLQKNYKFFKWRLSKTENRIDAQEDNFARFGEFIAMIAETIPMDDPEDIDRHKERIQQL
ncbi:MAG: class I tRNA ligase family protein, partial [Proteobacteria bacterium]|nr:class I tRNA ligase family protein [Pseudomonadota bacterium]